jgi:2-iminobutanoate/2-iminopropanoate deaminase
LYWICSNCTFFKTKRKSGELVEKFDEQVEQALINMKNVLEEGGSSLSNVIQTTLLLTSMEDFQRVNEIYSTCLNYISSKS